MTFRRNRVFWTVALQIAIVNFYLGGFGPAQPLLRIQQHTSLTIAGLHGTAMGLFSIGVLIFVFSPPIQLTLLATLITGLGTSIVINAMVSQLAHHYSQNPTKAVSQASGIASVGYILGTLSIGTIAGTSINWRLGLLAVIPVSIILYLMTRNVIGSEHAPDIKGPPSGSLNHKFWISWFGFIACISTEYAIAFWAAALLRDRVGSSAAISTVCIVAVGTGMGFGRWFGPNTLKCFMLDRQLKAVMIIQFIGFTVLWFSHELLVSLFALFVVGIGTSMQFALTSLRLIGFSQGRPDLAIGQTSLAGGIAIAGAPIVLGVFGDHLGISRAYLMVPVLIIIALATVIAVPSSQSNIRNAK
jgi:predicted MFS family arabinose efflux permease